VLGGTQSLHTNGKDEALALPTEAAAQLAIRTQQVIACESGAASTVDPLAGSYYVEQLTDRIEREAEAYIAAIDQMGGMVAAIEQGYPQREIERSAYAFNRAVDDGTRQIVGVNCFQSSEGESVPLFRHDEETCRRQAARVAELRTRRDNAAVNSRTRDRRHGTHEREPDARDPGGRSYATVGEICQVLATSSASMQNRFTRHNRTISNP
jgi:methylmalonyl-CoA mutase N-terminal domain/subunit